MNIETVEIYPCHPGRSWVEGADPAEWGQYATDQYATLFFDSASMGASERGVHFGAPDWVHAAMMGV